MNTTQLGPRPRPEPNRQHGVIHEVSPARSGQTEVVLVTSSEVETAAGLTMHTHLLLRDGQIARIGSVVRVLSRYGRVVKIGAIERISVLGLAKIHNWTGWVGSDECELVR